MDLPSVCVQQCQWEPGAADVSFSASVSHPCPALRGGGVRTGQKSAASEGTMASIVRPQCHSQQAQPPPLSARLKVASTPLKHTEESRNPVDTDRMEPPGLDNLCLVCTLLAAFF